MSIDYTHGQQSKLTISKVIHNAPPVFNDISNTTFNPITNDYFITATYNGSKAYFVTATDVDNAALTYSKNSNPFHGDVVVNIDGSYIYTPTKGYVGNDSFGINASDGTNTTTVNVSVFVQKATIALIKTISGNLPKIIGDVISYNLEIKNTGNVTIKELKIIDDKAILESYQIDSLLPDSSKTVIATHALTQADIHAGTYSNTATATGKDPFGIVISDISGTAEDNNNPTIAAIEQISAVSLVKTPTVIFPKKIGDEMNFNVEVQNVGNMVLYDLEVFNNTAYFYNNKVPILAPDSFQTITAFHIITEEDVLAGKVINSAIVIGKDILNRAVRDTSGTTRATNDTTVVLLPAPITINDTLTTSQNTDIKIPVINNDSVGFVTTRSGAISITNPQHGTAIVLENSTPTNPLDDIISYTPEANFKGTDTFTYTICGSTGRCSTASIFVNVENLSNIIHSTKSSSEPILNLDGTFNWTYTITLENKTNQLIDSVFMVDDLSKVFDVSPQPTYEVTSVLATGTLKSNGLYDGSSRTDLLLDGSSLSPNSKESITIDLKVNSKGFEGKVYNQAVYNAVLTSGKLRDALTDDVNFPGDTDPTETIIPEIELVIPNAFSPNGDGFNQYFELIHASYLQLKFEVFNRWGNSVYKSNDYQNDWDGKGSGEFLGQDLPSGTYYYILEITNTNTGKVTKTANYLTLRR